MPTIVEAALKWRGEGYVFGGPGWPPGDWDCSSFVSTVLNEAEPGIVLPGGGRWGDPGYPPHAHGPVVSDYASWAGAETVTIAEPGDLLIWGPDGHIGIAIGGGRMISALNPSLGVRVTDILGNGPGGRAPDGIRRVLGVKGGRGVTAALTPVPAGPPTVLGWLKDVGHDLGIVLDPAQWAKYVAEYVLVPAGITLAAIAGGIVVVALISWGSQALLGLAAAWAATRAAEFATDRVRSST